MVKKTFKRLLNLSFCCLLGCIVGGWSLCQPLAAQDLEQIGKKNSFKVNGGVSANQVFYYSDGTSRRDPYNYFLSGRLTLTYLGISAPLSFSFSNQRLSYGQPFNILGLSPKYKWVTAHLGWRNMTFSPYTLSGHAFFGAGVEIEPIKGWKSAVMYGRMLKAVELEGNNRPSYERFGMGFKTEYKGKDYVAGVSMFAAKDNFQSLNKPLDTVGITPQQNVAIGINLLKRIHHWTLALDVARSALTRDMRSEISEVKPETHDRIFGITKRTSTTYYNAYKAGINYQFKAFSLGAGYERIDPGYRTLGAYFFNNDLESLSGNFATSLFKNKLSFSANVGQQRDNLDNTKLNTMKRWVTSGNISFIPTVKWNFNASYSNFQSFTNVRPQVRPLSTYTSYDADTLNFILISQSAQASAMRVLTSNESVNSSILLSGSMQFSSQKSKSETMYSPTFYNGNLSYSYGLPQLKWNFNLGANTNVSGEAESRTVFIGPILGVSKTFYKDLIRSSLSGSWNTILLNGKSTSKVFNINQSNSLTLAKKHALNATFTYLNMAQPSMGSVSGYTKAINEVTATVGYSYSF